MARSRNIKPGFFTNDVLGELPAITRLLFAGLWVLCDREGRIEDRPKKIRAEVLPYDQFDADEHLESLRRAGFIERYEAEGVKVIQVVAWAKHQNPHVKESPSTLPAQCKNSACLVQEKDEEEPSPERAGLIPSLLIPDSLSLDSSVLVEPAAAARQPRATRVCPESFVITDELRAWALEAAPKADLSRETEKFRDHTFKTARADWEKTWRNWMRKASDEAKTAPTGETSYARQMREKYQEITPLIAAKNPNAPQARHPMEMLHELTAIDGRSDLHEMQLDLRPRLSGPVGRTGSGDGQG